MGATTKFFARALSFGSSSSSTPSEEGSPKTMRSRPANCYRRLGRSASDCREERTPKGYVPVLVGTAEERVLVRVSALKKPGVSALLDVAAQEFGYRQDGALRVLCDSDDFRRIVNGHSKTRRLQS